MNLSKTTIARLRGYVFFVVNGKRFWRYDDARAERVRITDSGEPVDFSGWNILLGWRWFYLTIRLGNPACVMYHNANPEIHPARASALASTPRITAVSEP
jgi:hypothetical protein